MQRAVRRAVRRAVQRVVRRACTSRGCTLAEVGTSSTTSPRERLVSELVAPLASASTSPRAFAPPKLRSAALLPQRPRPPPSAADGGGGSTCSSSSSSAQRRLGFSVSPALLEPPRGRLLNKSSASQAGRRAPPRGGLPRRRCGVHRSELCLRGPRRAVRALSQGRSPGHRADQLRCHGSLPLAAAGAAAAGAAAAGAAAAGAAAAGAAAAGAASRTASILSAAAWISASTCSSSAAFAFAFSAAACSRASACASASAALAAASPSATAFRARAAGDM